jgi:hypothetical protein
MFGWFKSKELVTVVSKEKDVQVLIINNARVTTIWSGSPDSWSPHRIDFVYKGVEYNLVGAWLLKQVCRAYTNRKEGDEIYFSAVLTIKGTTIISVNLPETM